MEFNEKLQHLRKQKGLTQEDLAQMLFVSRTAVSKWEAGRGYPNIASLKAIAKLFDITIDELLSGEELLAAAQEDQKEKQSYVQDMIFGLLDISVALFFVLPIFAERTSGGINAVSLLALQSVSPVLLSAYFAVNACTVVFGILTLVLQNCRANLWMSYKNWISLILNVIGILLHIISLHTYPAVFLLALFLIKLLILIKNR